MMVVTGTAALSVATQVPFVVVPMKNQQFSWLQSSTPTFPAQLWLSMGCEKENGIVNGMLE